jgi:hypothetical protein
MMPVVCTEIWIDNWLTVITEFYFSHSYISTHICFGLTWSLRPTKVLSLQYNQYILSSRLTICINEGKEYISVVK